MCKAVDLADKILDRITGIYDSYMRTVAEMVEDSLNDADLVKEAVLVDRNYSAVNLMYVLLTEEEFAEAFARVLTMDDHDVLSGLLDIENYLERSENDGNSNETEDKDPHSTGRISGGIPACV